MTDNRNRKQRSAHPRWVPISLMKVSPRAQREYKEAHAAEFAADFDFEGIGYPVVNHRDGHFFIVDGQHRIAALKMIGWGDQQIQCECYEGLSEAEEAELFLKRDKRRAINAFEKFRIAVVAGRDVECDVDRIVRANGLRVSHSTDEGSIAAVATLRKVYARSGGPTLGRTLRIIRDAYGTPGFKAEVIDGIGLVCQRYNGQLDDAKAIGRLSAAHGGVNGLVGRAEQLRRTTGNAKAHCVAAAAVDIINAGRGGPKMPSWWKSDAHEPGGKS